MLRVVFEERSVAEGCLASVRVVVLEETGGVEGVHELGVDVVFEVVHPAAHEGDAELAADGLPVASRQQSQELTLWHVRLQRRTLQVAKYIARGDG